MQAFWAMGLSLKNNDLPLLLFHSCTVQKSPPLRCMYEKKKESAKVLLSGKISTSWIATGKVFGYRAGTAPCRYKPFRPLSDHYCFR